MNEKRTVFLVAIAGIGLLAAVFWYVSNRQEQSNERNVAIFNKQTNPLREALPKTNPFEAKLNPFEGVYKNPFDRLR